MTPSYKYNLVATGGTFDRLHIGHEALLTKAFTLSHKVIIGITSDEMVMKEKKILKDKVMPYDNRVHEVKAYLKEKGWLGREIIAKLENIYGPTVIENPIEAVICTRETRFGAIAINKERKRYKHPLVDIVECKFIVSDDNRHISSTRIRLGEIDRDGTIYRKFFDSKKLPSSLRESLQKPIGAYNRSFKDLLIKYSDPTMLISVGDYISASLLNNNIHPDIVCIDYQVERQNDTRLSYLKPNYVVRNKAGSVSKSMFDVSKKAIKDFVNHKKKSVIKVIGEEDLAVLPFLITAPLNSLIVYGQPENRYTKQGVVEVLVTEDIKHWAIQLFDKFK